MIRTTRGAGLAAAAAALVALAGGCTDDAPRNGDGNGPKTTTSGTTGGSTTGGTTRPTGAPQIALQAPARAKPGDTVALKATVKNTTAQPIVVLGVTVHAGDRAVARTEDPARLGATVREGGRLTIDGIYQVDEPGVEARAPGAPRWDWMKLLPADAGAKQQPILAAPILAPGESISTAGDLRVQAGGPVEARAVLQYRTLEPKARVFRVTEASIEEIPAEMDGRIPHGWRDAARARAVLVADTAAAVDARSKDPIAWTNKTGAAAPMSLPVGAPRLYPLALAADESSLPAPDQAEAKARIEVEQPGFDLPAARAKAGITSTTGEARYFAPGAAWLVQTEEGSVLVSKDRVARVKGNAFQLIEVLSERDSAEVTLYGGIRDVDPDGLGKELDGKGFTFRNKEEKGGTYTGTVLVARAKVFDFFDALTAHDRGILFLQIGQ